MTLTVDYAGTRPGQPQVTTDVSAEQAEYIVRELDWRAELRSLTEESRSPTVHVADANGRELWVSAVAPADAKIEFVSEYTWREPRARRWGGLLARERARSAGAGHYGTRCLTHREATRAVVYFVRRDHAGLLHLYHGAKT